MNCDADHDPNLEAKYVWTVNGKPLTERRTSDSGHFKVRDDNSLLIESPTVDDSGVYACTVSTKLDSASKSVSVLIEDVPPPVSTARIVQCDDQKFHVTIKFEHMEPADRLKPVKEFWIRYLSDPDLDSGKWIIYPTPVPAFKNELINDEVRLVRSDATIQLRPFGTYVFQIIARNEIGDSPPFQIAENCKTLQKPPDRNPTGVRVEGSQPDNLIVYWNPMPRDEWNAENFAYKISYRTVTIRIAI